MSKEVRIDELPGFEDNCKVGKISVSEGDSIVQGDLILVLEDSKGTTDFKSNYEGTILSLNVSEGDIVEKDYLVLTIDEACQRTGVKEILIDELPGFEISAKIGKINISNGQSIKIDDLILTLEDSKGTVDLKSKVNGDNILLKVEEGQEVELNSVVAIIETTESVTVRKVDDEHSGVEDNYHAQVVVLGGGPGGYVAAIHASQLGKSVIIVEEDNLGGTCLNRGCIPTKSMVQSLKVNDIIKNAEIFGIENGSGSISMKKLIDRKDKVVKNLVFGLNCSMAKHDIIVLNGRGIANDEKSLLVNISGKEVVVSFDKLILAPGSIVAMPRFDGANAKDILTSDELLELTEIPESLIIIGGRVIAMEFAFIYRKLGSKVTVIQRSDSIFPNLDEDIIEVVRDSAIAHGITLVEGTNVQSIKNNIDGTKTVILEQHGEEKLVSAEKLAIATGRMPNLEGLKLDKLGVELSERPWGIKVDDMMKTTANNIYAIGDATNIYNLAHVASKQGIIAANNICGADDHMDYSAIPEAVFTDPEIGLVGMSEKDCKKAGLEYLIGKFPYASNGKSLVENETNGFIKVIANKNTRKVIGAGLIGLAATDLLSVFTNLIANGNTIDEAKDVVYAHPTVSETVFEAILDLDGESIHK